MIKKRYAISLCIIVAISTLLYAGLASLETMTSKSEAKAGHVLRSMLAATPASTQIYSQKQLTTYSWRQDHYESCDYLTERIKFWMNASVQHHGWPARNLAANTAANYLKLYELNGCHEYYRNTSIGPFHLALELKALEKARLE